MVVSFKNIIRLTKFVTNKKTVCGSFSVVIMCILHLRITSSKLFADAKGKIMRTNG